MIRIYQCREITHLLVAGWLVGKINRKLKQNQTDWTILTLRQGKQSDVRSLHIPCAIECECGGGRASRASSLLLLAILASVCTLLVHFRLRLDFSQLHTTHYTTTLSLRMHSFCSLPLMLQGCGGARVPTCSCRVCIVIVFKISTLFRCPVLHFSLSYAFLLSFFVIVVANVYIYPLFC